MNSQSKKYVVYDLETKPDLELLGSEYEISLVQIHAYIILNNL